MATDVKLDKNNPPPGYCMITEDCLIETGDMFYLLIYKRWRNVSSSKGKYWSYLKKIRPSRNYARKVRFKTDKPYPYGY